MFLPLTILCAQTPESATPPAVTSSAAAPARPPVAPDAVVAEMPDGKKITAADLDKLLADYPPQIQSAIRSNPARNLTQVFLFKHLRELAEQEGLDKQSPYKQTLEYQRTALLAQAEMNIARYKNVIVVLPDAEKIYNEHPERFREAKVKAIYVAFNPLAEKGGSDKKLPNEAAAKAKIEDLRKQILAGADFGQIARANSDDKVSAAKDGDFGIIQKGSPYPEALKNTVFALNPGAVSDPIRQPNGFYLIRVDEVHTTPFSDVSSQIMEEIRQKNFDAWMKGLENRFSVKIENQSYFGSQAQPQLPH